MESNNNSTQRKPPTLVRNDREESSLKGNVEFESPEDISNFYLKKTAFLLNDILKCVEDTHSRYKCKEQIESLSKNLYDYRSEVNKFVEKTSIFGNPNLLFPPQIFSPPTIVYRENRGAGNGGNSIGTRMRSFSDNPTFDNQNNISNEHLNQQESNMFQTMANGVLKFGTSLIRKIVGRGED